MKHTNTWMGKAREFFIVLVPIFVTQLALVATGFCDTVMAGHFSSEDLAGVAVGANLYFPVFTTCISVLSGLTPTIVHAYGAGKRWSIVFAVRQGFWQALFIAAVVLILGWIFVPVIIHSLQLEPRVEYVAIHWILAISCGMPLIFLSAVLRNLLDAHGFTRLTMLVTLITVPINIVANFFLVYGWGGFPALGGVGSGIGTAVAYGINLLLNVLITLYVAPFRDYHIFRRFMPPLWGACRRQLALGLPIGGAIFCEVSIFSAVGLFMAGYGTAVLAAHQAALNFTTQVYMIPLSISMALTILVGYELGSKHPVDARKYARLGRILSLIVVGIVAALLIPMRSIISAIYTEDPAVHELLLVFLAYTVGMQLADALNAPLQGILRGAKDVRAAFLLAVISNWAAGLPIGWLLAEKFDFGPYGYWIGLIAGLVLGGIFLGMRFYFVEKKWDVMYGK